MAPIFVPPLPRSRTFTPAQKEQRQIQSERNIDEQEQGQSSSHEHNVVHNSALFPTDPLSNYAATAAEKALLLNLATNAFSPGSKTSSASSSSRKRRRPSHPQPSQNGTPKEHHPTTLRSQHLSNLATILHRSLLEGNYARADRAWSLLLRSESGGRAFDVRRHGRWGIGAEVLLWRYAELIPITSRDGKGQEERHRDVECESTDEDEDEDIRPPSESYDEDGDGERQHDKMRWSEESFRKAREYYETLILHYPPSKIHPNSVDAGTFYPAMFNLWVYEVDQYGKRARTEIRMHSAGRTEAQSELIDETEEAQDQDRDAHERSAALNGVRREQLRQAKELLDRLTEVTSSPPHDQNAELLELRGHIELWVGDLHVSPETSNLSREYDVEMEDLYESRRLKAYHTQRAKQSFRAATKNGGRIWEGAARLLDGDDEYEGD